MDVKTYRINLEEKGVPVLGYFCWYSIRDIAKFPYEDVIAQVAQKDLDLIIPPRPQAGDIFRRASQAATTNYKKQRTASPDLYFNYVLKDAGYDEFSIFKVLTRDTVDTKAHVIESLQMGQIVFNKHTKQVKGNPEVSLSIDQINEFQMVLDYVRDYCQEQEGLITPYTLREMVRKSLLYKMSATCVRPGGGVYFVDRSKLGKLEDLDAFFKFFDNCSLFYLPTIDDLAHREMVAEAFEEESVGATQDLIGEITELLQSRDAVSAKKLEQLLERWQNMSEKVKHFQNVLGGKLSEAETTLEICKKQLHALYGI